MTDETRGLDDVARIARTDRSGMLVAIAGMPAQVRDAWTRSRGLELPGRHAQARAVAVLGMGTSALGGDLTSATWVDRLTVPLVVIRDQVLPRWVGADTLVVASSHDGRTEETLHAVEAAFRRRCPVAVITTGGPLGRVAEQASLPLLAYPDGGPARAAVGHATVLLAGLLERAGLLPLTDEEVEAGATAAEAALAAWGPDIPTDANLAKQLAWAMVDRLAVVTGSGPLAPVARRWKAQLNENAKSASVWDALPEASHDTVVGYPRPASTADHLVHLFLRSAADHPGDALRAELAGELLAEASIASQAVMVPGDTAFARVASGIVLGDLASVYLAVLYGTDPTPTDAAARLRASMAVTLAEDEDGREGAVDPA